MPSIEEENPRVQLISSDEEEAYMAKASGMGQTKNLSIISDEEEKIATKVPEKTNQSTDQRLI